VPVPVCVPDSSSFPSMFKAVLNVVFPTSCLHCEEVLASPRERLCAHCLEQMTLVEPEGRCRRCFAEMDEGRCARCIERGSPFKRVVAAFEYDGPAASLMRALKFGKREELAKDLASWMVVQFLRLDLPLPDLIVPVPQSWVRRLARGYSQSLLIAKEVGALLERPVEELLRKRIGDFPQTGLSKKAREKLSSNAFQWKRGGQISDKSVLLVDDVMTTGATLRACARVLEEGFPSALYALTFCV